MHKALVIALREYRTSVRTKSFVIAVVLMPIFMFGGIGIQAYLEGRVETDTKKIALIDYSGKMREAIASEAERYNATQAVDPVTKKQSKSFLAVEDVPAPTGDFEKVRLGLSDRVRSKELFAFIEISPDILTYDANPKTAGITYYSNEPTYRDIQRWLSRVVNDRVRAVRLSEAGIDRKLVDRAMTPVDVDSLGLLTMTDSGEIKSAQPVNDAVVFGVPFAIIMLMWVLMMMTTQPLLQGVIEEKMQKISEVLLGSARPFDLMAGKLIGTIGVAITLILIYVLGAYGYLKNTHQADLIPYHLLGWFFVFLLSSILMFGSLFLAAGSCCNEIREAQNLVMPIWLVLVIPMMTLGAVMRHPSGEFATVLSLIPPCTPMVMMVRLAVPPGVPYWQPLVGVAGVLLTTLLCIWVAGRIFRVGLLMQGKPPKLTDLVKYAIQG